jgi:hypothetical protein
MENRFIIYLHRTKWSMWKYIELRANLLFPSSVSGTPCFFHECLHVQRVATTKWTTRFMHIILLFCHTSLRTSWIFTLPFPGQSSQ